MDLLKGKVAVITGSSRGLGLAIAEAYATEGAAVVLAARTDPAVQQAAAELQAHGHRAVGMAVDIANEQQVNALSALALDAFGKIDIWVNNAGSGAPYGPTVQVPVNRFTQVINTNILGTYYGSIFALRVFLPQGYGKLINLLGRGDQRPTPMQNAYASSKAWVRAFTLALAEENRDSGVGIYAFNPGLVLTDMLSNVQVIKGYEEKVKPLETVIRLWANTARVPARKAVWLASSATDGKTGLAVNVLTPGRLLKGVLQEAGRIILHQQRSKTELTITSVSDPTVSK